MKSQQKLLFASLKCSHHFPHNLPILILKGFSHLVSQVQRSNPKLLLKGEGRSPLKYTITILLLDFEYFIKKRLASRLEFGFPFSKDLNSCREIKLLVPKVLPCKHLGGLSLLEFGHYTNNEI